jgi:hypothetical protein
MQILKILFGRSLSENSRYRQEDEVYCIDIFLTNMLQLFDRRDPSPFREKDLDEDFVRFLVLAINEIPLKDKVKMVIKMPEQNPTFIRVSEVEEAIHNYFAFEMENVQNELHLLFKSGRWSLLIGLVFIVFVSTLALVIPDSGNPVSAAFHQGLQIMAWVALWRPLYIFLYEWWPFVEKIRALNKLTKVKVELITG